MPLLAAALSCCMASGSDFANEQTSQATPERAAAEKSQEVAAPTTASETKVPAKPGEPPWPRGLDKIVEMVKSGVGSETMVAFVESTSVAYTLNADVVLRLHKAGVPSEVVTALLRHGSEVREQMREESRARQSQSPPPTQPVAAAPTYSPAPTYYAPPPPVYVAPQYVYPPTSYYYSYPSSGFLLIGTSYHNSGYRGFGSHVSYPRYYCPPARSVRPVSYTVSSPVVPAGFFRDKFQFRH